MMKNTLIIIAAGIIVFLIVMMFRFAHSHEAPSGWKYPPDCCAENHCRPVSCDALVETREGIRFLGLTFTGGQIKASGDKDCHVCIGYNQGVNGEKMRNPICVFVKPEI